MAAVSASRLLDYRLHQTSVVGYMGELRSILHTQLHQERVWIAAAIRIVFQAKLRTIPVHFAVRARRDVIDIVFLPELRTPPTL